MKILVSGGGGKLATHLGRVGRERGHEMLLLKRKDMDVSRPNVVERVLQQERADVLIHTAAELNLENPDALVQTNIIGSAMVANACRRSSTKLVYISTDHVYSTDSQEKNEPDPLLPFSDYGWSKLGGECAAQTCPGALIVRGAFCPTPYPHPQAFRDVVKNLIYQDVASGIILDCLEFEGVLNIGSERSESLFDFARRSRPEVGEATSPKSYVPKRSVISTKRLRQLLARRQEDNEDR